MAFHPAAECSECGAKFSVSSSSPDEVLFCPFCGDGVTSIIDPDAESLDEDDDELDGFQDLDDTSDDE